MSPALTLQGAVAHCDMPIESGPTMLLPYSQRFVGGYIAFNRPEFIDYFAEHHVQLPLRKGDAVFFNPALYHGAGANRSADIRRMANLLQISSPFGRAMESLDRGRDGARGVSRAARHEAAGRPQRDLLNAVVATAEGYPFPTNLDRDQPIGSLAPPSSGRHRARRAGRRPQPEELDVALRDQDERRTPMTTLGVIGLGRIGAFHTETLSGLEGCRRHWWSPTSGPTLSPRSPPNTVPRQPIRWRSCWPRASTASWWRPPPPPMRN